MPSLQYIIIQISSDCIQIVVQVECFNAVIDKVDPFWKQTIGKWF